MVIHPLIEHPPLVALVAPLVLPIVMILPKRNIRTKRMMESANSESGKIRDLGEKGLEK